ncbi:S-protein homolog 1 [Linum perenne]
MKSTYSPSAVLVAAAATVLFLSTLGGASVVGDSKAALWAYTHVHVINEFSDGKQMMVHCKSKNDDMGTHWVPATSEYEWRFRPSVFGNTLFWCHVWKGEEQIVYDAYYDDAKSYERKYMDHVRWVAKDDGIYLRQFWKGVDVFWLKWP